MTPTPYLRWVADHEAVLNPFADPPKKLQQWFSNDWHEITFNHEPKPEEFARFGEWRDVPVEKE